MSRLHLAQVVAVTRLLAQISNTGGETPTLSLFRSTSFSLATQRGGSGSEELEQKILEGVQAPLGVPQGSVRVQLGGQEEQLPVLVHRAQRQSFVQLRHARGVHFVLSEEEGGGKKKSLRISLTAADTQEVFLTGISNSNLARARRVFFFSSERGMKTRLHTSAELFIR